MRKIMKIRGAYENRWKNLFEGLQKTETSKIRLRSSSFLTEESLECNALLLLKEEKQLRQQ
jgi:hypothetical protein